MGDKFWSVAMQTALVGAAAMGLGANSPAAFAKASKTAKTATKKHSQPKLKLEDADAILGGKSHGSVESLHATPSPAFSLSQPLQIHQKSDLKSIHGEVTGGRATGALKSTNTGASLGASGEHDKLHVFVSADQTKTSH